MSSASGMLWGKTSRPAPRVSTLVPFIIHVASIVMISGPVAKYLCGLKSRFFSLICSNVDLASDSGLTKYE